MNHTRQTIEAAIDMLKEYSDLYIPVGLRPTFSEWLERKLAEAKDEEIKFCQPLKHGYFNCQGKYIWPK